MSDFEEKKYLKKIKISEVIAQKCYEISIANVKKRKLEMHESFSVLCYALIRYGANMLNNLCNVAQLEDKEAFVATLLADMKNEAITLIKHNEVEK